MKNWKNCRSSRRPRGVVMIMALVALAIVMTLLGSMLKASLLDRRQLRAERNLRQTELLVDAGVRRAAAKIVDDADYRGETWDVPADQIVGNGAARVTIASTRKSSDQSWQLRIVAEYPLGGAASIRRSRIFAIPTQPPRAQE